MLSAAGCGGSQIFVCSSSGWQQRVCPLCPNLASRTQCCNLASTIRNYRSGEMLTADSPVTTDPTRAWRLEVHVATAADLRAGPPGLRPTTAVPDAAKSSRADGGAESDPIAGLLDEGQSAMPSVFFFFALGYHPRFSLT